MDLFVPSPGWRVGLAVGVLALLLAWETAQPYFESLGRGRERWLVRGRHGAINLGLGALNALLVAAIFAGLWLAATEWAMAHRFGLLQWVDVPGALRWPLGILLLDAWMYFWHRLNHTAPFLWRFHRLHHADRAMDVTTASRFHTGEIVLSSVLRVPVLALIGCRIEELAIYELLLFAVVQFHHANIGLPARLDRVLRAVIVTPSLHKVHHSVVRAECDSNYSSLFSWWDRLFRTRRISSAPRRIVFGVDE
ncbi:MAG: sterol desaturase family protein [Opitutaceae bacterium]